MKLSLRGTKQSLRAIVSSAVCIVATACTHTAGASPPVASDVSQRAGPICAGDAAPYRDLDFLVGAWEFFTMDGRKIADQTYSSRERGCLVLEDWTTLSGETGTGMNFVDPFSGRWRQVWMSPRFHLDYSGGLVEPGVFVLEGRMFPNDGSGASEIRGVYTQQSDGSVTKEFLRRADAAEPWQRFFIGVARRRAGETPPLGVDGASSDPAPSSSSGE